MVVRMSSVEVESMAVYIVPAGWIVSKNFFLIFFFVSEEEAWSRPKMKQVCVI